MKKAAVAHWLLTVVYLLIRDGGVYRERGGDYFDQRNPKRTAKRRNGSGSRSFLSGGHSRPCDRARWFPPRSAATAISGASQIYAR